MTPAERNAHYGKLNDRFDERSKLLRSLGFTYQHVPLMNLAVFSKVRASKPMTVPAGVVMHADEIAWEDEVERIKRFCA